jgi:NDP-sugar pyrophosphorylase family protein
MLQIAILAGGFATRLQPLTESIPKSMIEICGYPFVHWQTKLLARQGIRDIIYCVSHMSEQIVNYLGDGSKYGVKIRYSHDGPTQLGTGGAIINALPLLNQRFMVQYGDSYLRTDYSIIENRFLDSNRPALMAIYENNGKFDKSNVSVAKGGLVTYQKSSEFSNMSHIDYGLSCFDRSVFSQYTLDFPLDLAQVFSDMSRQGLLIGHEVEDRFYEIGSQEGILDFKSYVERNIDDL